MSVEVVQWRCPQNHPCPSVRICTFDALSQNGFNAPEVNDEACTDCGKCISFCPMGAIQS